MAGTDPVGGGYRPTAPMEIAIYRALSYAPGLSPSDVGSVDMMMQGGEWELAFEVVCTQIDEYDVPVSEVGVDYIERLGRELGVDAWYAGWICAGLHGRAAG
ncbi:hypothetical protein GCM10027047_35590 [Rhodococcus aerolatus]